MAAAPGTLVQVTTDYPHDAPFLAGDLAAVVGSVDIPGVATIYSLKPIASDTARDVSDAPAVHIPRIGTLPPGWATTDKYFRLVPPDERPGYFCVGDEVRIIADPETDDDRDDPEAPIAVYLGAYPDRVSAVGRTAVILRLGHERRVGLNSYVGPIAEVAFEEEASGFTNARTVRATTAQIEHA